jgi:hypothetical protein
VQHVEKRTTLCVLPLYHSHALSNNVKAVVKLALDVAKDNSKLNEGENT